jgi:hypothetical protein
LRRSIAIFEEVRNEVELARSWRSYSELLRQMPGHEHDPALVEEARLFAKRADEVFAKMRASAAALTGQAIFAR